MKWAHLSRPGDLFFTHEYKCTTKCPHKNAANVPTWGARLVGRASRVQRPCPQRSSPGFESDLRTFAANHPPSHPNSSHLLHCSINEAMKAKKKKVCPLECPFCMMVPHHIQLVALFCILSSLPLHVSIRMYKNTSDKKHRIKHIRWDRNTIKN